MQYLNRCQQDSLIFGFPQKLIQVFVNLLSNATDASEPGQSIVVESHRDDGHIAISVKDQGKGIAETDLNRIFEPFFTTKMVGDGTGLGLSLAYNIIEEHGGSISVTSKTGEGCCFDIRLPTTEQSKLVSV